MKGFDWFLFLPMVLLIIFGIVILSSTSAQLAKDQLIFATLGLLLYFFVSLIDFRIYKPLAVYIFLANILLLFLTLFFGVYSQGAIRWIPIPFSHLTLQPSEFMKVSLAILLAAFLDSRFWDYRFRAYLLSFAFTLLPAVLIFRQPDLGTSLVLVSIWLGLVVSGKVRLAYLLISFLLILAASPLFYFSLQGYQRERLINFLSPQSDPLGSGYHVLQSKIAVGSGRIWGRGFGRGTQSHLRFLPEYHTDFIFATLSEEWGFLGALVVLLLYGLILFRILAVSRASPFLFGQLLSIGIFAMLLVQVVINVGMNLGLAPITGIPLPFLSSGGSSLATLMISLGMVQAVARRSRRV